MEIGEIHNCGGVLKAALLRVEREFMGRPYVFDNVKGFRCDKCGDEVITPEAAKKMRATMVAAHKEKL